MKDQKRNVESENTPHAEVFNAYRQQLDQKNERRERLVRVSRDITQASKKLIFELHRGKKGSKDKTVEKAKLSAEKIINDFIVKRLIPELPTEEDQLIFFRAFSPGLQEFVEAITFLEFLENQRLLSITEIDSQIQEYCKKNEFSTYFRITCSDYLLGITDLTGELMRLAIDSSANGDHEMPFEILKFMQSLCKCIEGVDCIPGAARKYWPGKIKVMKQSLRKVEESCFSLSLRKAEGIPEMPQKNNVIIQQ